MPWCLGCSRFTQGEDEGLEAVSEQQISQSCVAAYVQAGSVWLAFADGRHTAVAEHLAQRSPLLRDTLDSAGGNSEYLQHRERIFQWHQYVLSKDQLDGCDTSKATLTILRQLLAVDFLGDEDSVKDLAQQLGARLFPEGFLKRPACPVRKYRALKCREQLLEELPKPLALSVLQATPASLHECLLHLPCTYHQDALLARFPSILSENFISLTGQESAKPEACKGDQDTLSTALSTSAAFPQLRHIRLSFMCMSQERVSALSDTLQKLTAVTSITLSNCLLDSSHMKEVMGSIENSQSVVRLVVTSCLFRNWSSVAEALSAALVRDLPLEHIDLSKLPYRDMETHAVVSGVAQLARLGKLKSLKFPLLNSPATSVSAFWSSLTCCTQLSQLALTDSALNEDTIEHASGLLCQLTKLRELEIRVESVDASASMSAFYESLTELTALTKLRLASSASAQNAQQPLANALSRLLDLRHLELPGSKQKQTWPLTNTFCSTLQQLSKLTLLSCKGFHVPSGGHEAFQSVLKNLPELSVLKLNNNTNVSGTHFVDLSAARQVRHLQVAAKVHWQSVASSVVESLQAATGLEKLELYVDFHNDGLSKDVVDGLAAISSLTCLRLKGVGFGTHGVNALASAVQSGSFSKLLYLRLETVGVNTSAVQELALALPKLPTLQHLSLSFSRCKDGTIDPLLTQLNLASKLTALEIMHARLPDTSLLLLNHALSKMPSLSKLSLSSTCIGASGINVLARSLTELTALTFLSLSGCPFYDRGAATLGEALKGLLRLRELNLNSTCITEQGATALLATLSHVYLTHVRFKNLVRSKAARSLVDALKEPWVFF